MKKLIQLKSFEFSCKNMCLQYLTLLVCLYQSGDNPSIVNEFIIYANESSPLHALYNRSLYSGTFKFTSENYKIIQGGNLAEITSQLCFGRETAIPLMFQSILNNFSVARESAPAFYHYIERHIEVDGDKHGPMSENLLKFVCEDKAYSWSDARDAAIVSIKNRIQFWDSIEALIESTTDASKRVEVSPIC